MRVGMVGTRFAGIDGVTLESTKVADLLRRSGHDVVWFGGERDEPFSPGVTLASAHFRDEAEWSRRREYFGSTHRRLELVKEIRTAASDMGSELRSFVTDFDVDVLMPQNALAIPLQLPLALALTDVIATGVPAIAHHHDFGWERARFKPTSVADFIDACLPPRVPGIEHIVINSIAQAQLARRKGITAEVLPNVMDFAAGPVGPGDSAAFRRAAGVDAKAKVILQPTRVVPRKSIETTIDLAARLGPDCVVIITHGEGDEGERYGAYLRAHAEVSGVDLRFTLSDGRDGNPTLADAYAAADLVSYPSRVEGFGNALIEAFFFRRPVLVRTYPVYGTDIKPTGVMCIEMKEHLTEDIVEQADRWLSDPAESAEAVETNYEIGNRHFSMERAQTVIDRAVEAIEQYVG